MTRKPLPPFRQKPLKTTLKKRGVIAMRTVEVDELELIDADETDVLLSRPQPGLRSVAQPTRS
ncbi:MAG: hypothetical protein AAFO79_03860 [Pseudomonadota bacterium]